MWLSLDLVDNKPTVVMVMAWCQQAIIWANVDPELGHHMALPGHNEF